MHTLPANSPLQHLLGLAGHLLVAFHLEQKTGGSSHDLWKLRAFIHFSFKTTSKSALHCIISFQPSTFDQAGFSSACRRFSFAHSSIFDHLRLEAARWFQPCWWHMICWEHLLRIRALIMGYGIWNIRSMTGSPHIKILQKHIASIDKQTQRKHQNQNPFYLLI